MDAIWLSPFYPSPMADGGYDVADPRGVDPRFGTLGGLRRSWSTQAHAAASGSSSTSCPTMSRSSIAWFQAALASPPGSPEHARFHILRRPGQAGASRPNNWVGVFGGSTWSPLPTGARDDEGRRLWYLHLFDSSQPDLNWDNPEILATRWRRCGSGWTWASTASGSTSPSG